MNRRNMMNAMVACPGAAALVGGLSACATPSGQGAGTAGDGVPFFLYDSFTTSPFSGNPAPVVVLDAWLPVPLMQAFATEMNQSEVAFVLKGPAGWQIRWFTPAKEVPLNGHATLSAAALIFEKYEPSARELVFQTTSSGPLGVSRNGTSYLMDFPRDDDPVRVADIPAEIEADLGVRPAEFWVNKRNVLVFRNAEEVRAIRSRLTKSTAWAKGKHVMVTAPGTGDVDYVLRYFAPLLDIPEDPVTGVVHCTLAPFWARRLGKNSFKVRQLSARGGDVATGVQANGRVLIGGPCVRYAEGRLHIAQAMGRDR
ncbi:PhzF family phenazine biosynthesis protein [Xenophilus azovorans]|uniref:PhzF family phenazine biosynthesis protein n=1 Tax=Xenophilus azovorans TaxID=151755 RepID=UPI0009FC1F74|nr:PhzF family phenazine biosynthesis protein [Xenophilus azovorans]